MSLRSKLFIACWLYGLATSVNATIFYEADAYSTFELIDAGGMTITAEPGTDPTSSATSGSGIVSIDADSQIGAGPGATTFSTLELHSDVSGSAGLGSIAGTSDASVLNGFLITLENDSGSDKTATFRFTYTWLVEIFKDSATDAPFETGFASSFFHLDGFFPSGTETLAIDDGGGIVPVSDWLFHPSEDIGFAGLTPSPITDSGTTSVLAYVTVPGVTDTSGPVLAVDQFSVITDASGSAIQIPEPTTLLLFVSGLISLFQLRKSST